MPMYDAIFVQQWPWWAGGAAIGSFVILYSWIYNRSIGMSRTFESAVRQPFGAPRRTVVTMEEAIARMAAEQGMVVDAAAGTPNPNARQPLALEPAFMVLGVLFGAIVAGRLAGMEWRFWLGAEFDRFVPLAVPGQMVVLLGGGFLVGFGARMAGGCPSGHGLGGLSTLSVASFIAVAGYFLGGIPVTFLVGWLFR